MQTARRVAVVAALCGALLAATAAAQGATTTPPPTTTVAPSTVNATGNASTTVAPNTTAPANTNTTAPTPPPPTTTNASGANNGTGTNGTATNGTTAGATTAAPVASTSSQSLAWWQVGIAVLVMFLLIVGACWVTLMWQQNAIRDYKSGFEEKVKQVGRRRNDLADELEKREQAFIERGMTLQQLRDISDAKAVEPQAADTTAADATDNAAAAAVRHRPGAAYGRMFDFSMRTSDAARQREQQTATEIENLMRRKGRERDREARRKSTDDPLTQSLGGALAVNRNLESLRRTSQLRSLQSLDL